jgi:carbon monoxide dehydrogenase subunit G
VQLHLDGSKEIDAGRQKVYGLLTDTSFLAETLPDSEGAKALDDSTVEAKMKVRVAIVSATIRLRLSVSEKVDSRAATMTAEGSGSGSTLKIRSRFELSGERPTTVSWTADTEVTGVMAGLGSPILKGYATKKVEEIFGSITGAIEARAK